MHESKNGGPALTGPARDLLHRALSCLQRREIQAAQAFLRRALEQVPGHPELLLPMGISLHMQERFREAVAAFREVAEICPEEPSVQNNLGSALGAAGDAPAAVRALKRACELAPERPSYWYNLAKALESLGDGAQAAAALTHLLTLDPSDGKARLQRADLNRALGKIEDAECDLRYLTTTQSHALGAWVRLVNLKALDFTADDLSNMAHVYRDADPDSHEKISMGFAYGQALESGGRFLEAFEVFSKANAAKKSLLEAWDPLAFHAVVRQRKNAFVNTLVQASEPDLGHEAILIFGMPRSGSTLLEQMLSSHPRIEGAGEIGDLSIVIHEESVRRGVPLEQWSYLATEDDWTRLGRQYLERTARWRERRPMFTDKELGKWSVIGAARAMLPGAHFVHCLRDPVETCWSCFKLEFERGVEYSYDLEHLGAYWKDCQEMIGFLAVRYPGLVHTCQYERLVSTPEQEVTQVLQFCGLDFDPACLRFYETERQVHTASAGQVRRQIRQRGGVGDRYGPLLDPLRRMFDNFR